MSRAGRLSALGLVLLIGSLLSSGASAATLTVNSLADDTTAADGLVTLREAVLAAEADAATDLGETGSGPDVIVFDPSLVAAGNATILLATVGDTQFGPSALLVTTEITIQGPSGGRGIALERDGAVSKLRHFAVTATGDLTLENLTLTNGRAAGGNGGTNGGDDGGGGGGGAGLGGAIYSQGTVALSGCTLSENVAQGGDGGAGADNVGNDAGGGGGGGGLGGNGGTVPDGGGPDGGGGGGGSFGNGGGSTGGGGGGGGGTATDGLAGVLLVGGAGGTLNGGLGGTAANGGDATGPGGGGGGGSDERNGGNGGFAGGGGGSGENDSGVDHAAGAGGYGGGGGGGGEDDSGGAGGFGGGGGGGSEDGTGPALSAAGGFGAGNGGNFGGALAGSAGGGGGAGLGGAIFNHNGTLQLTNTTVSGNTAQGGSGGGGAFTGGAGRGPRRRHLQPEREPLDRGLHVRRERGGRRRRRLQPGARDEAPASCPPTRPPRSTNTILGSDVGPENVENTQVGADPGVATVSGDASDILIATSSTTAAPSSTPASWSRTASSATSRDNGGPTDTHAPHFPSSPAIDASAAGPAFDQRGAARPQGPSFDIGAVEVAQAPPGTLAPGDLLFSEFDGGSVVDIRGGGDFSLAPRFAYGLTGAMGLCTGPGGDVYVAEFDSGEVTVMTTWRRPHEHARPSRAA